MPPETPFWKKDSKGDFILHTMTTFQAIPITGHRVGIRLEWATSQTHLTAVLQKRSAPKAVQLGLSLNHAKQVADALRTIADAIEKMIPPTESRH
jgi:hypothetical protein